MARAGWNPNLIARTVFLNVVIHLNERSCIEHDPKLRSTGVAL
jgi:hypothetical protein